MPFTLRNLKADLDDLGSNFDGAPDLEFRAATKALGLPPVSDRSQVFVLAPVSTSRPSIGAAANGYSSL